MRLAKAQQKLTAWIAFFAILLAALAPAISSAESAARGEVWTEICSVTGTKMVRVGGKTGSATSPLTKAAPHVQHCAFCFTHAVSPALVAAAGMSIPLQDSAVSFPSLFYRAPRPPFIWASAQSRAPPAHA